MKKLIEIIVCMLLIAAVVPTVGAANWTQMQKVLPLLDEGTNVFYFGEYVSVQGDTALIASRDYGVYVFTRSGTTWTQQAHLELDPGQYGYKAVSSVSLSGDTALVGSTAIESAYVFTRTGTSWSRQAKLVSNSNVSEYFGCSVSLSGDTALIGADYKYENLHHSGAAYVFTRSATIWTLQAKLLASEGQMDDCFGRSVAVSGNTALIGADWDDDIGYMSGSVYVFTRTGNTWTLQVKLHASDERQEDTFGNSISFSGDTALIGAPGGDSAAYVFTHTGTIWTQQAKLVPSGDEYPSQHWFAHSVSISGDTALIGAAGDNNGNYTNGQMGSAYVFTRTGTTWTQHQKLTASDGAAYDEFGSSVSIDGNTALFGALADDATHQDSGSAYVFTTGGENEPPVASFTWTPLNPEPNQTIVFDASTSHDPDGSLILYEWDWNNDGSYEESHTTPSASHSWSQKGNYPVILRVNDKGSVTSTKTITVPIGSVSGNQTQTPTPSKPKTPGFELVFIIGAIAVALLLWKKKRNI